MTPVQTAALCTFSGGLQSPQIVKQGTLKNKISLRNGLLRKKKKSSPWTADPNNKTQSVSQEEKDPLKHEFFFSSSFSFKHN